MLQHRVSFLALTVALLGAPLENGYAAGPVAPVSKQIQVTTLKQALEYAYSNNATLEATRAGLRATDEELPQATAGWKPRLSASISQTAQRSRVDQGNAVASYSNPLQASITLRQSLYAGGSTVAATRKAKSDIMAGQYGLIGAEQETLFSGVDIYATIKQSEHILEAAQKNESVLLKTVELAEAKHAAGEASITDVMSAKGDYATAIANKEDAERDVVIAKATFLQRTGVMPGALKEAIPPIGLPGSLKEAEALALSRNPNLKQAAATADASKHTVDVQTAELLPSLDLQGSASRTLAHSYTKRGVGGPRANNEDRTNDLSATVTLTVPLYDAGLSRSKIRQASQLLAQNKLNVEQARRATLEGVKTAWASIEAARESAKQLEVSVAAKELSLEGLREEYAVGEKPIIDVLDGERKLFEARVHLYSARKDLVVTSYRLLASIGGLTAKNMKLNVTHYDPIAHSDEVSDMWFSTSSDGEDPALLKGTVKP